MMDRRSFLRQALVVPLSAQIGCGSSASSQVLRTVNARDMGAAGDGRRDDTAALQRGIDEVARQGGGTLRLPAGIYAVRPTARIADTLYSAFNDPLYGPLHIAIILRSNVRIAGEDATIRLIDHCSTDAAPLNLALFHSNETLENLSFEGLTFDLNGQRNPISPGRLQGRLARRHHAAILFSGIRGRARNVAIQGCRFLNSAGANCIVTGLEVGPEGLGRQWTISGCAFRNNGLDTHDHSSIYLWAEDSAVRDCSFVNDAIYGVRAGIPTGMNSACELHGANSVFERNLVIGSNRGVFLGTNTAVPVSGLAVRDNRFRNQKFMFVDLYYEGHPGDPRPSQWSIEGNDVEMSADETNLQPDHIVCGIGMLEGGPLQSVRIARNRIRRPLSRSGRASAFCVFGFLSPRSDDFVVEENISEGFADGVYAYGGNDGANTLGTLALRGNQWLGAASATMPPLPAAGLHLLMNNSSFDRVTVEDDLFRTAHADPIAAGVLLRGNPGARIRNLRLRGAITLNNPQRDRAALVQGVRVDRIL